MDEWDVKRMVTVHVNLTDEEAQYCQTQLPMNMVFPDISIRLKHLVHNTRYSEANQNTTMLNASFFCLNKETNDFKNWNSEIYDH